MITQEFYLDNEKLKLNYLHSGQIILPVYQEKNSVRNDFILKFPADENLVPSLWISDLRLVLFRSSKQLITLQVSYEPGDLTNLDEEGRVIITPTKIQGGWQEAHQYLTTHYPNAESCGHITRLDLRHKMLTGCLDLSNFPKLREIDCSQNYLTGLVLPESVKKLNAAANNIRSLSEISLDWETVELDLSNNPLNIPEIIQTIKNLHKNSELERQEIGKIRTELEKVKKSLQVVKDNHKNNIQVLQKERQEEITAAQDTVAELNRKLDEKEKELAEKEKIKHSKENNSKFLTPTNNWWPKIKTPAILVAIFILASGIYYFIRKYIF